jgi:hypothetical protein
MIKVTTHTSFERKMKFSRIPITDAIPKCVQIDIGIPIRSATVYDTFDNNE